MRVSVGAGTPELYQELLSLDDAARCERLKHLAMLGLMYLGHGQPPPQPAKGSQEAAYPPPPSPSAVPAGLANVVKKLKLSLDELESRP